MSRSCRQLRFRLSIAVRLEHLLHRLSGCAAACQSRGADIISSFMRSYNRTDPPCRASEHRFGQQTPEERSYRSPVSSVSVSASDAAELNSSERLTGSVPCSRILSMRSGRAFTVSGFGCISTIAPSVSFFMIRS